MVTHDIGHMPCVKSIQREEVRVGEAIQWRNLAKKMEETKRKGRREREERKRRKGERMREMKEDRQLCPLIYRRSNGRSSLGRELKPIYSTRAMLQEVWILPPLVYFHPKRCLAGFL